MITGIAEDWRPARDRLASDAEAVVLSPTASQAARAAHAPPEQKQVKRYRPAA